MSSPENALVQADKSKIDDGHPSGQNDWGVAALFNMITPHFFLNTTAILLLSALKMCKTNSMVIRVVEFLSGGYKIGKFFA